MNTPIGDKLKAAMESKKLDINSYIWKGNKTIDENGKYKQSETRLIDMNTEGLNKCYNHCKTMLFNTNPRNPGRYLVLDIISDQRNRCGAELFLRWLDSERGIARFSLVTMLSEFLIKNKEAFRHTKPILSDAFSKLPEEYENLPLTLIMDGCLDRSGAFNKKHITRTFILKQGIWLTPSESKDLLEFAEDKSLNRLEMIRENLGIKEVEMLYINSRGMNYTQMRAMLNVKPNKKYIELTTIQLETLRYRLLFNLEEDVKKHIAAWENRMLQIEEVCDHKNIRLWMKK